MAFQDNFAGTDDLDLKTSKFNEAYLKMIRIHKLQDTIIQCSFNPLLLNEKQQCYNYEIIIRCCGHIISEVWGKLTEEERKESMKIKNDIDEFLTKYPVHLKVNNQTNNKQNTRVEMTRWKILDKSLYDYNLYVRNLLSRTGYDSPNAEDDFDGL